MNLKALTAFCLIQRHGSLSSAAAAMSLSQPAVSRLVSNLEHEIGFALFHRDRRALRPTDEARRFHREAERILAGIEQLRDIAVDIRRGAGQRLRVVAMSRLANGLLPRATAAFHTAMPDVDLTLETHHRRDMERWVSGRQFDVGFGPLPIREAALDAAPLGSVGAVAVFAPGGPFSGRRTVSAGELAPHPLIALTPDTLMQAQSEAIFAAAGVTPRIVLRTSSSQVAGLLAAQGLGYTICDPFTARTLGDAVESHFIEPLFPLSYGVLTPAGQGLSSAARFFATCMSRSFEEITDSFSA